MTNKLSTIEKVVGTWMLDSIYYKFEDGSQVDMYGSQPIGILMYDHNGNMNAQLGNNNRQIPHTNSNEKLNKKIGDSYMAYYGKYYEESPGKIIHKVIGCVNPSWIGEKEIRFYAVDKDILKIWTPSVAIDGKNAIIEVIWLRSSNK